MRILFLLTVVFLSNVVHSQDLNKIRNADTIYVFFEQKKNRQLHNKEKWAVENQNYDSYYYVFTKHPYQYISFIHHPFLDSEEKTECRSFLKIHKDLIVNYRFLTQLNIVVATQLFNDKKKVYLIDKKLNHKGKIKLRSVQVLGALPQHEE